MSLKAVKTDVRPEVILVRAATVLVAALCVSCGDDTQFRAEFDGDRGLTAAVHSDDSPESAPGR